MLNFNRYARIVKILNLNRRLFTFFKGDVKYILITILSVVMIVSCSPRLNGNIATAARTKTVTLEKTITPTLRSTESMATTSSTSLSSTSTKTAISLQPTGTIIYAGGTGLYAVDLEKKDYKIIEASSDIGGSITGQFDSTWVGPDLTLYYGLTSLTETSVYRMPLTIS